MLVTCLMLVVLQFDSEMVETAVQGKVLKETTGTYNINFSEYAKQKGYAGDLSSIWLSKERCIEDK